MTGWFARFMISSNCCLHDLRMICTVSGCFAPLFKGKFTYEKHCKDLKQSSMLTWALNSLVLEHNKFHIGVFMQVWFSAILEFCNVGVLLLLYFTFRIAISLLYCRIRTKSPLWAIILCEIQNLYNCEVHLLCCFFIMSSTKVFYLNVYFTMFD